MTVALLGILCASAQAVTYLIDPNHSSVTFRVKHIVGKVAGRYDVFAGTFDYDPVKPASWKTAVIIGADSINTGIAKRDEHLRSPDFFDAKKYPNISFKSTKVTNAVGDNAKLEGDLSIHGVTKPIVLDLEFAGSVKDPKGKGDRVGVTATGHLSRLDYGVGPSSGTIASMVGNDVDITIEIEGVNK